MLRTTKNMKDKYEQIQNYLFELIPEKWEEIYLYASVVMGIGNNNSGEMFFYYQPKGLLKKKLVNVYEVPQRFNISEEQYMKVVKELYDCIYGLKQDFIDTEQELWNSLTISIEDGKFKIEYNFEELPITEEARNARYVIWKYKYLNIGGDKKEEKKILDEYFSNTNKEKIEVYETALYLKTENTAIAFDKEDNKTPKEVVVYEKEENKEQSTFIKRKEK